MEIFKLFGSVFIDESGANKKLDQIDGKAAKTGKTFGNMAGTVAKWGAGIAIAAGGAVVGLMALAEKTMNNAASMKKLSIATQMNIKDTQEWAYVFKKTGSSTDVMQAAINKLGITMGKADDESKKATQAFKDLGISINDTKGQLKPTGLLFQDAITKLAGMKNMTERNIIAQRLFGGSYTELLPILNKGADGIEELKKRANELGLVMSEDGVNSASKFKKAMDNIKETFGAIGTKIMTALLPYLSGLANWITEHMPALQKIITDVMGNIVRTLKSLAEIVKNYIQPAIKKLFDILEPYIPKIKALVSEGFEKLVDVIKALKDNLDIILPVMGSLLTMFTAYKIVGTITSLMKAWRNATILQTIAQTALNIVMSVNPIFLIISLVAGLVAGIIILWNTNKGFRDAIIGIWNGIKKLFVSVFNGIVGGLKAAWDGITGFFTGLWDWLKSFLAKWGPVILLVVAPFIGIPLLIIKNWDVIVKFFADLPNKIAYAIGFIIGTLIRWYNDVITWITTEVPKIVMSIVNFFASLPGKIAEWLKGVVTKLSIWAASMATKASTEVPKIINSIVKFFAGLPGEIAKALSDVIGALGNFASDTIIWATTEIPKIVDIIVGFFKELPGEMFNIGKDIMSGLWNGIKSTAGSVGNSIKDFVGGLVKSGKSGVKAGIKEPKIPAGSAGSKGTQGKYLVSQYMKGYARGGDITENGPVLVGESGPEILSNARGKRVTPIAGNITFDIHDNKISSDYDVDRIMNQAMKKLRYEGVY